VVRSVTVPVTEAASASDENMAKKTAGNEMRMVLVEINTASIGPVLNRKIGDTFEFPLVIGN
jgi:hypothetical protein